MVKLIGSSQIIALPGGFSSGDEPDGSGKFIGDSVQKPLGQGGSNEVPAGEGRPYAGNLQRFPGAY